jgi:hypothetical protein
MANQLFYSGRAKIIPVEVTITAIRSSSKEE